MERFIALLRGVNVGGNNKISMPELRELFVRNGFSDAVTYINSGNVIFSTDETDESRLVAACEAMISARFGFEVRVMIISATDLAAAVEHAPAWWGEDSESKHNAIFVLPPASASDIFREVGAIKPEYEKAECYGRVIFWSAPLNTFSRTRFSRIVGSSAYGSVTIRNENTARKLEQLACKEVRDD